MGMENIFHNDPLTGGRNMGTSPLLGVTIPAGLQIFTTHGYRKGTTEGLEIYRGNVNEQAAASALFNTLNNAGWQLRLSLSKGFKAIYLYQRDNDFAVLSFHKQGLLTVLEIWRGPRLAEGASLTFDSEPAIDESESYNSLAGEEYGPLEKGSKGSAEERWGGNSPLEEREL